MREVLELIGPLLPRVEVDPPLRDPDDVPVVAAAMAGNVGLIVTGDADLLDDVPVRWSLGRPGIKVVTATQALRRLR